MCMTVFSVQSSVFSDHISVLLLIRTFMLFLATAVISSILNYKATFYEFSHLELMR